ncbi:MAG: T9SS type A sorting domain-containing protein [Ferruginibacter sp.]|nr:T9SS type A sorting domain-containing protein [Ferruginibacter sp.]
MRNHLPILFIFLSFLAVSSCRNINAVMPKEKEGQKERMERDIKMMKDPALGIVPSERLLKAKEYKDELLQSQTNAAISGISWSQLGPKNQGGRSRAMLVDANDATGNTVWVGSVGGGLWKTTNISAASPTWVPVNDFFDNLSITSIVQDPSNAQVMYFCTGEQGYFNADAIRGFGVWKTTNGGATWSQLPSTTGTTFYHCQRMAINSAGVVFVSTRLGGLQRSADGGNTWTKVLGTGLGITGASNDHSYDVDIDASGNVYATLRGSIHKSTNAGVTFAAAQTLPITADRIEVACALSDANYVYALIEDVSVVNGIIRSTNGGTTWTSRTEPDDADPNIPASDFSRSQAWYDLTIAVDPNNRDVVFVGGVDLFKSFDGAGTWTQISHWYGGFSEPYVHADQHYILFRQGSSTTAYFVNDGGIYQTTNADALQPTMVDKGTNYVTAQFYACAIHPTALTNYFLAGAQDNGSHQFTQGTLQNTTEVTGGDGAFCHIDQNEPQYQFTSYVYNDFYRSTDGGTTWTNVSTTGGDFISPTDYDDAGNILYMANAGGSYRRWTNAQTGSTFSQRTVAEFGGANVSALKVSPNTANRVFFGLDNGDVVRVDNANGTPSATNISTGLPTAYVTCVEVQTGDDDHLLVTYSNYGTTSIWETINGGASWTQVEGNLPDMPVRWALFNPNNNDQAVIATELGVWSTDNLNGGTTNWGASNSGLANVRVDMLQIRQSDKVMIAATHGRGLFISSAFAAPTALFEADKVTTYRGVPINFTSTSYNATSWSWNFGDATSSTAENPAKFYSVAGKYNVTLTINSGASSVTKSQYIHVLPNRGTPYTPASGGNFDVNPNDFGVDNTTGTPWQRGNSAVAGKNGTTSGSFAWVTGLTGNYVDNSDVSLMTPNYNFTAIGAYMIRFQSKRNTELDYDGFRVEYTLDSGRSWTPLGTTVQANWYNFANMTGDAVFPVNQAFFAGAATTYTLYSYDMTFLQSNQSVAFRIRFKSDVNTTAAGVALDDFEIIGPINIALAVKLLNFGGVKQNNNIVLNWLTKDEVNIDNYVVERSTDGFSFNAIAVQQAKNNSTNTYQQLDVNAVQNFVGNNFIYYRLKISDKVGKTKYSNVIKVDISNHEDRITVGPNPFIDNFIINSINTVKQVEFFNTSGSLVYTANNIVSNKVRIGNALPSGVYFIKITFSTGKVITQKLIKSS